MLEVLRKFVGTVLASPEPVEPAPLRRGETVLLVVIALAIGGWVFAFQMRRFLGLGTTSDLYVGVQLATSWLDGRFLHDNFFGDFLRVHVSFFSLLLAPLAYPFGAPGLLAALGLASSLNLIALVKILRLARVPVGLAVGYATLSLLMPLAAQMYQNDYRAFDVDLLEPALALWLAYYLLKRKWLGSLLLATALISVKEDAPLLVVVVAAVIWSEDLIRSLGWNRRNGWNGPAATVLAIGLLALPVLLVVIKSRAGSGANLAKVGAAGAHGYGGLLTYLVAHLGTWLGSPTVSLWLRLAAVGTFGLIFLRPHLLIAGVATTLTAWLVQDALLWPPRYAPALAFFQLAGCLAFASLCELGRTYRGQGLFRKLAGIVLAALAGFGLVRGLYLQRQFVPQTTEIYTLSPALKISPADRQKADRLFALYRREGRREEPVVASGYLFRYAHDRNLFWPHSLVNRPRPVWILWDTEDTPLMGLWVLLKTDAGMDLAEYELKGKADRFLLFKHREGTATGPTMVPDFVPVAGEAYGALRMQVRFKAGRAGHYEPLVSIGPQGNGELFFVRYLSGQQLVVGMENMGTAVHYSRPVDYEPGRTYELELFCGSMARPVVESADRDEALQLRYYQNIVRVRWAGEQIMDALALPHVVRPEDYYVGANMVRSGSADMAFSGTILSVRRGGYPELPAGGLGNANYGAVRLLAWLPAAAAGVPEPLLVVGVPGHATLGYVRVLPGGKVKLGAEFWGVGTVESEAVAAASDVVTEIVLHFPALYPPVGDPRWGDVPRAVQEARRSRLTILLNGRTVLDREVKETGAPSTPAAYGENPVGGSWVGEKFTGRLVQGMRLPLSGP